MKLSKRIRLIPMLPVVLCCTSCETTDQPVTNHQVSAPIGNATPQTGSKGSLELKKGMPAAEILSLMGNPATVEKSEEAGITYEVWRYHVRYHKNKGVTATSVKTVPLYNPFTNTMETEMVPEFENEMETVSIVTQFLVIDGRVMEWKQTLEHPGSDFY